MVTLSLAMIVKDEEEVLGRCLDSCYELFDEIIVVDTGSTDSTKEILKRFPARVLDFEWVNDFSEARNFSFDQCTSDYIMWLDADDVIKPSDKAKIRALKAAGFNGADSVLMIYEYAHDEYDNSILSLGRNRVVKRERGFLWRDPIHEFLQIDSDSNVLDTDVRIHHYRTASGAAQDGNRNLRMLESLVAEEGPNLGRNLYYFGKELYYAGRYEEAIEIFLRYLDPQIPDWIENKYAALGSLPECYRALGDLKSAEEAALRATREAPNRVDGYLQLGIIKEEVGNLEEACFWLEKASEIARPETQAPLINDHYTWLPHQKLTFLYDQRGMFHKAFRHAAEVLRWRPHDRNFQYNVQYLRDQMVNQFEGKLGWTREDDQTFGPSRIRNHNIVNQLRKSGIGIQTVDLSESAGAEVIIHRWRSTLDAIKISDLKKSGKKVVLDLCEDLFSIEDFHSSLVDSVSRADLVVCCSSELQKKALEYNHRTVVIPDAVETEPEERKTDYCSREPTVVFFGYGGNYKFMEPYEDLIRGCGYSILSIHEHDTTYGDRSLKWELDSWADSIKEGDIVLLVSDPESGRCKSNNRLTQAMALGMPVVCSPLPAYQEIAKSGENCFVFHNESELRDALLLLLDGEKRQEIGSRAAEDVFLYQPEIVAMKWLSHLCDLFREQSSNRFLSLGILPLPEPFDNQLLNESDEWRDPRSLAIEPGSVDYLYSCYLLEHFPQVELSTIVSHLSSWVSDKGKMALISTDADQAIDAYKDGKLDFSQLSKRFFQENTHQSITSFDYLSDLLRESGFSCIREIDLRRYPLTIVPDVNHPEPEPLQRGIMAWRTQTSMEDDADLAYCIPTELEGNMVDVVVPVYNNVEYTKLCLESILEHSPRDQIRLIVIDAGSSDPEVLPYLRSLEDQFPSVIAYHLEKATFSEAVNYGIKSGQSPYVCIANNDIIVSPGWLEKLRDVCSKGVGSVNPWSNCDLGWKHQEILEVEGVQLVPDMNLNEVSGIIDQLPTASYRSDRTIVNVPQNSFNAFYCTLIQRSVLQEVGLLDESFRNGGEDADWCYRASLAGYKHLARADAFVFHFGAKTRKNREIESYNTYHQEDLQNHERLRLKWSRPRVALYTGGAWEPWSPLSLDRGGIGGSETAAIWMALELEAIGYQCFVFNECQGLEGEYNGVQYLHWSKFRDWASENHADILVSSRTLDPVSVPLVHRATFVWVHDIWLNSNRIDLQLDRVDRYLCLSPWHKRFFCDHHGCPPERVSLTTNGLDPERFRNLQWSEKHPHRFIYSSSPDRGLDCLLEMWPEIRGRYPNAELHVFYGFFNWLSSIKATNDRGQLERAERIMSLLNQQGVYNHDRVGQRELAYWFKRSSVWLQPEPFTETNCITAKEAMAAGCMPICSDVAALSTTVGFRGIIVPFGPWQNAYATYKLPRIKSEFLSATFHFLDNQDAYRSRLERNRREMLEEYSWKSVARSWDQDLFKPILESRS